LERILFVTFFLALVSGQCNNAVNVGSLTVTEDGTSQQYPIAMSGGTSKTGSLVKVSGASLNMSHGPRVYIAGTCVNAFESTMFKEFYLLGKTLSYDVDLSQVGCACNAALYLVAMPAYNSANAPDPTKCGDYYCDANQVCGIWCPEMDVMEANNRAFQITPHKCSPPTGNYYPSCDGGGCGQNVYRMSSSSYGPGSSVIDTTKQFHVATTFSTDSSSQLNQIRTVLSQGSKSFTVTHNDSTCPGGYLESLTAAFKQGMVLTMSYWGDTGSTMSWLDVPPCDINTSCNTNTAVIFSNIGVN